MPDHFDRSVTATRSTDDVRSYLADVDSATAALHGLFYALRVERDLLPAYAARIGADADLQARTQGASRRSRPAISLRAARAAGGGKLTASGRAVDDFVFETSSLIVSRMLMIRFSEDNNFLNTMISNGGIGLFSAFAEHAGIRLQTLMRTCYRQARDLYTNLFDEGPLDWVLERDEGDIDAALLQAMFLLNRWDFSAIDGDVLSGVYDQYLDVGRRRRLGEVFTRPEICDYVLSACGVEATSTVLDPACGSGSFLVQRLAAELGRIGRTGTLDIEAAVSVLGRMAGLDINPFSVTLAQMQVIWHLLPMLRNVARSEVSSAVRRLIAAMRIEGGHTSLDTFGSGDAGVPRLRCRSRPAGSTSVGSP